MSGTIRTGSLAAKPAAFFVIPDSVQPLVASATEEAGPYPGAVSGGQNGFLAPAQSGDSLGAVDVAGYNYVITRAGANLKGEFAYKGASEANYKGKDDPRHWWGMHSPISVAPPGADNCAWVYHQTSRKILVFGAVTNTGYIYGRDVDTARYDAFTLLYTFTLQTAVSAATHGARLLELPNGAIMLVLRTSANNDFDVYHAIDPTINTWTLVSRSILLRFNNAVIAQQSAGQFQISRAGEWIRLVFADSAVAGRLNTLLSRDRGMTWVNLGTGPTIADTAEQDDRIPFDLLGLDDSGSFILVGVVAATPTTAVLYTATGTGAWATTVPATRVAPQNIHAILLARDGTYVYAWHFWSDLGVNRNDGWDAGRAPIARAWDFSNATADGWRWHGPAAKSMNVISGCEWQPCRAHAGRAGPGFFFYGGVKTEAAGLEQATGTAWYADTWTERSFGDEGPGQGLDSRTTPLVEIEWNCGLGRPSDGATTQWAQVTGGAGADTILPNWMSITGAGAGDVRYYEHPGNLTAAGIWHENGGCVRWMMRLDTLDSTTAADNVAIRVILANAAGNAKRDVTVRISPASVAVVSNVGGAVLATINGLGIDTGATGAFHEFRLSWGPSGTLAQLAVLHTGTGVWVESASFTMNSGAAAAASLIRYGHLGQAQATQMQSWWREIGWAGDGTDLNQLSTKTVPVTVFSDAANNLFGAQCSAAPQYVAKGLHVSWGGVGGAESDPFTGDIAFAYAKEGVFVDSPRVEWRSTTLANQSIIAWTGYSGFMRWRHDAAAVFNCNNRFVLIDYDSTSAFASPTATETIDLTAFDTGTTPLTVNTLDGNTMVLNGTTFQFVAGELVGYYVRSTNGASSGKTWKVTRHPADGVLQFDALANDLTAQGVVNGTTLVVFASHGVKRFASTPSENYMRIRLQDTETAEGYHMLGTAILGRALDITVPLDWAHGDDDQANVTQYRTRSGVAWAFEEGPPQRTITGRVVGDAERWRDRFRGMMRSIGYEARVCALCLDGSRPAETLILGRVRSGGSLDNGAWYVDSAGKARPAGDLSLTFVEEP